MSAGTSWYTVEFDPRDWKRIHPLLEAMNKAGNRSGQVHLPNWHDHTGQVLFDLPAIDATQPYVSGSGRWSAENLIGASIAPRAVTRNSTPEVFFSTVQADRQLQAWDGFKDNQTTWAAISAWLGITLAVVDAEESMEYVCVTRIKNGHVEDESWDFATESDGDGESPFAKAESFCHDKVSELVVSGKFATADLGAILKEARKVCGDE